jgi:branched-chain amino acid transport system ATP-binding protein
VKTLRVETSGRGGSEAAQVTPANAALTVAGLSVAYGNVVAVHDATFTVAEGDACAITGPNGNGKSSILMGVTGMVRRRGEVRIFGAPAKNGDVRWAARHGLTLVPERRQLYPDLSASDNIILGCYTWTRSLGKARRSDSFGRAVDLFPELKPHLKQAAGTLSGGQQQMVAIARGLAASPKILAVDEPCLGLAESVAKRVYDVLAQIHAAGTTLIVVEEAPRRALTLCNRRVEVRNGMAAGFAPDGKNRHGIGRESSLPRGDDPPHPPNDSRGDAADPGDTPDPDGQNRPGSAA